jgi:hypothetical protein
VLANVVVVMVGETAAVSVIRPTRCAGTGNKEGLHTDLVEAALIGEDGDMPVVSCASYMEGSC